MRPRELAIPSLLLVGAFAALAPGLDGQNAVQRLRSRWAPTSLTSPMVSSAAPGDELPAPITPTPTQPPRRAA